MPKELVDAGQGDLTFRIIGACMFAHNDLGPGHREIVYQRALANRFREMKIEFEEYVSLPVVDAKGKTLIVYKPDFRVEHCTWVDLKAHRHQVTGDDKVQLLDYFAADKGRTCNVGLLMNFGRQRLEWKREFPPKEFPNQLRKNWGRQITTE